MRGVSSTWRFELGPLTERSKTSQDGQLIMRMEWSFVALILDCVCFTRIGHNRIRPLTDYLSRMYHHNIVALAATLRVLRV